MELQHLRTFQVVARTLSFTQAAVLLNYAQSSITAQIRALAKIAT
jgi:DNA-binding transcriptional LysR family regulator